MYLFVLNIDVGKVVWKRVTLKVACQNEFTKQSLVHCHW